MKPILVAEDDPVTARMLEASLASEGFCVRVCRDGIEAWEALQAPEGPRVAVVDWHMPGMTGIELCRRIRAGSLGATVYLLMLTMRQKVEDIVEGLASGANDYLIKPFRKPELLARVRVGIRVVTLQDSLNRRVSELEQALAEVRKLQGLLPICSYCKKIRDDKNYWRSIEEYISDHSEAQFTHGICPDCVAKLGYAD